LGENDLSNEVVKKGEFFNVELLVPVIAPARLYEGVLMTLGGGGIKVGLVIGAWWVRLCWHHGGIGNA